MLSSINWKTYAVKKSKDSKKKASLFFLPFIFFLFPVEKELSPTFSKQCLPPSGTSDRIGSIKFSSIGANPRGTVFESFLSP